MNPQPVDFLALARMDIEQAQEAYSSWRSDGPEHFIELLDETVACIAENPDLFPKRYREFRRAPLRNSYYGAFYVIEPSVTVVVAVLDLRQRPSGIRRLLRTRR